MSNYTNSELCLIWLDSFLGLEYKHKKELYNQINGKDGIKEVLQKGREYITKNVGECHYSTLVNSANASYLNYITDGLKRRGIQAVTLASKAYPDSLKQTPFAPLVLYTKGNVELLSSQCFAVVGSRKSLPISLKTAESFSSELSKVGLTLVTGIAEGVDETVLRSALDQSGRVISVLGGGFDSIYPAKNTELVELVAKKGLVITEYPPEIKAFPHHFPIRNRIIAGLSKGTLVVSGAKRSGTQYTANYALEYGRDLFVVPYSVGIPSGAGCNYLIKNGAMLCDCIEDILDVYGLEKEPKAKLVFTELEQKIIDALKGGEQHIQNLVQLLNRQVFEISATISMLEVKGVVNKNGVNVYGLTRNVLEE